MADNIETIGSAYDASARGDVPAVLAVLAPDVSWTEAEGFPYGVPIRAQTPFSRVCS